MDDESPVAPFSGRDVPQALEDRVVRSLRESGFLERRSTRAGRRVLGGVLLAAALAVAFVTGRWQRPAGGTADARPMFLLLLYEDAGYRDDRPVGEIIAEYAAWADSLRRVGRLVMAEKLGDTHVTLPAAATPPDAPPGQTPTGLFLVRAAGFGDATALAASSPHLRYGGRIVMSVVDGQTAAHGNRNRSGGIRRF